MTIPQIRSTSFGDLIRGWMRNASPAGSGLSVADVASASGIDQTALQDAIDGNSTPSLSWRNGLAQALRLDTSNAGTLETKLRLLNLPTQIRAMNDVDILQYLR